jgi:hypothetical protein
VTATLLAGLLLALASAIALDVGFVLQHAAASRLPRLELRRPLASARSLAGARRWTVGFGVGLAGWGLYLAALGRAPLSLVQAVAAGGIGVLVLLVALVRRRAPARREALGAAVATAGLAVLALSLVRQTSLPAGRLSAGRIAACAVLVLLAASLLAVRRSAAAGGVAAGLCYGLGDVGTKALLVALPVHVQLASIVQQPYLYLTLGSHGTGFLLLQRAFQRGGAVAAVAPMTAATNLLPMAAGVLVLGDPLPSAPLLAGLRLAAFAAAAAGAYVLAA